MRNSIGWSRLLAAVALASAGSALIGATPAAAQQPAWAPFVAVTPFYESDSDLDGAGEFGLSGVQLRLGTAGPVGTGLRAGVTLTYDYYDSSFSNPAAFGSVAPWGDVYRYGVSVPLAWALNSEWSMSVAPSVDWFRESGANTSDALIWGAALSAVRTDRDGNRIGIGIAAFDAIEETKVFPVLVVDWRLGDRWRLINPLPAGPTGPAGLELDYQFNGGWSLGVGAAYRSLRFRLSDSGPASRGIGEINGVPIFVRATYDLAKQLTLHIYAGAITGGELRVEDRNGNLLRKDDFDTGPFVALTVTARF
jgi:Domain of unknown function (DUF6268)